MSDSNNAKALIELGNWRNTHLPTYGSAICYDLGLQILAGARRQVAPGLKQVYRSLPHSEPQLRRHMRVFEQDGWIKLWPDPNDARNRVVEPTEKMLAAYRAYFVMYLAVAATIKANVKAT